MKLNKGKSLIQIAVLILLGGIVVLSLVIPVLPESGKKVKAVEVTVVMREAQSNIWSNTRLGMEQAAYDLGGELRFLSPDTDNSHEAQSTILLRELQIGTDALVIIPSDVKEMENLLALQAVEIPIVSIESTLKQAQNCILPDNMALGKALANATNDKNNIVLLLNTADKSSGVTQRLQSCASELEEKGKTVVIQEIKTRDIQYVISTIASQSNADVIIAFEPSATEAILAAKESIAANMKLYGVGSTSQIVSSLEQQSINEVAAWSDYAVGYLAVEAAIKEKRGISVNKNNQFVKFSMVRGEDIYEESNQKLLFPVVN